MSPRPDPTPAEAFQRWLEASDPEAPATWPYWQGNLAVDSGTYRLSRDERPMRMNPPCPDARDVADLAAAAAAAGRVELKQRRVGDGCWQYLATRLATRLARRHRQDPSR